LSGAFLLPKIKKTIGGNNIMDFFTQAVSVIQTILILIGAGLGIWGVVNLLEGYGNDNRATRSQLKRLRVMAAA
jgi:hypothetical protein